LTSLQDIEGTYQISEAKSRVLLHLIHVRGTIDLEPTKVSPNAKGSEIIKRTLSNLGQIVTGIHELRNLYGTGHGNVRQSGVNPRHARLVVGAGATLASFIIETFEAHKSH
jgi:hypothetical protein